MAGKESAISEGLELFNRRCHNPILEIDLDFKETIPPTASLERLKAAVACLDQVLKTLSVKHAGGFAVSLLAMAGRCPNLKNLRSRENYNPSVVISCHRIDETWRPKLEIFEWSECRGILTCNNALVKVLKEAKEVNLENSDEETEHPAFWSTSCAVPLALQSLYSLEWTKIGSPSLFHR